MISVSGYGITTVLCGAVMIRQEKAARKLLDQITRLTFGVAASNVVFARYIHMIHEHTPECIQAEESLVEYCLDSFEITCLVVRAFRRSEIPNQVTARNGYLISHWWRETSMAPKSMKTV